MTTQRHTDPDHHAYGVCGREDQAPGCDPGHTGSSPVTRPTDDFVMTHIDLVPLEQMEAMYPNSTIGRILFIEPASGDAGGRHEDDAQVAQSVEQGTENSRVVRSTRTLGTKPKR